MKPRLDAIGLIVSDLSDSISFYRRLGIDLPNPAEHGHVEATLEGGIRFMIDTIAEVSSFDPDWIQPSGGHRIALAFLCDSPGGVDVLYKSLIDQGSRLTRNRGTHSGVSVMRRSKTLMAISWLSLRRLSRMREPPAS